MIFNSPDPEVNNNIDEKLLNLLAFQRLQQLLPKKKKQILTVDDKNGELSPGNLFDYITNIALFVFQFIVFRI